MKHSKQFNWLIIALLIVLTPACVLAQETSSAIGGTVIDSDGVAINGATVVVTHIPTGSVKRVSTNDKGNYQTRGLRVGGPYTVSISKAGYGDINETDLYLSLGVIRDVDVTIVSDSVALDSVSVYGVAQSVVFNADIMGSGVAIDRETLENMPTISRSVADFIKIDSRINIRNFEDGISVSGVNNRYNKFSIDGVSISDPFGLENGGFPGLSQPFNIDTIEQLNVQLSPYDVTLSNFTGANINAVTKNGSNVFTGSLNVQYGDEDLTANLSDFTHEIYSLTLGGPIINDKLFFFLGYEDSSRSSLVNNSEINPNVLQNIADIALNVWGMDIGSAIQPEGGVETKENLLLKLDWNINKNHRASFRYTTNDDNSPRFSNFGTTRFSFGSHWYINNFKNDSYAVNLYSDWSPNVTTELRYSHSEFNKKPLLNARLPLVEIMSVDGSGRIRFGTEANRHANNLLTVEDSLYFEANFFAGNHSFKAGFDIQQHDLSNVFRRNSLGSYRFNSVEDFANGNISRYALQIGIDPNDPYPSAEWDWIGTGLFLQDNWMVNEKLTVQYGLRWDKPITGRDPNFNQNFFDAFKIRNDYTIASGVLQPRLGFNFDMSDELNMQVRGGVGIFSGGSPNVWLSNPFANDGLSTVNVDNRDFEPGELVFSPDPDNQPFPSDPGFEVQSVDLLEEGFKMPTVLKTNIAFEVELPWYGIISSFEYEFTKQQNAVFFEHLNLGDPTGTLPDGRLSYRENPLNMTGRNTRANRNTDFKDIFLLKNTGSGDLSRTTLSFSKKTGHFYTKASYTKTSSQEVHSGSAFIAASNWGNRHSINPNDPNELSVSSYQIENAFTFMLNYNNNFFGDTLTNIGLFWTSADGEPFSYVYGNDVNGDNNRNTVDLFYVPLVDEYVLLNPDDRDAFEVFLEESGLTEFRGQIAPRYAFKSPRINQWDLKIKQELPSFGFARASMFFSVRNLGNLINSDWGSVRTAFFRGERVAVLEEFDEQGRYVLDWNDRTANGIISQNRNKSQWQAQIGFRFKW